ncbi:MFS transporter [Acinetobacter pittii]|jgi:predicted MFS family arabinose efflux permease|uniref:MFS transporter n=1 Tax=Acinetobacter pittii TaxID=48296 RepID=A0AAE9S7K9_ACIPI|nr:MULTISPECIES: MFS transporter [Acinetobacter]AZP29968.1 MFS transporter [Acinetobacter pittii]EXE27453.1 major Facilitator Superfamily protein [Acinetobacter sp. 907131]EXS14060.1 major Facilitator Superfamily protein [Acinetobacter sp. 883425]MBK0412520.1 MFS transporter [Acinetobacter pittii]MBK1418619.1 MFS transporter [Acinetobacter pittii]
MKASLASSTSSAESDKPLSSMPRGVILLFAIASGASVANVYYAQPLLDILASDFNVSHAAIGGVVTATQIGCALALIFLVPLGDLVNRRRLMALQLLALISALLVVGFAHSTIILLAGMLAVGLLGTAMTQGLIAYAASAALPHEQGHVVGTAQSGVFIGLLLARVFSGGISDVAGWRGVYFCAAIIMLMIALPLWKRLPHLNIQPSAMRYPQLLASMLKLLRQEKVLQVRGVLALLMFSAFNIFWSALVLPLSAPPYSFSHTVIGSFGLVGVVGALAAARAGYWVDRGYAQRTSLAALLILLLAWGPLSLMAYSLWALVIGIVLLDLGGQALHVTNQSMIFRTRPEAHSRLVGLYMLFYAVGSGLGAISTTATYAYAGWLGVCALGACVSLLALLFWWMTRHIVPQITHEKDNNIQINKI